MPKSKHRRKGKSRRTPDPDPRPKFRHLGRTYRGALRATVNAEELDERYGDDDFRKIRALLEATLGETAAREIIGDVFAARLPEVRDLCERIAAHYALDLALGDDA